MFGSLELKAILTKDSVGCIYAYFEFDFKQGDLSYEFFFPFEVQMSFYSSRAGSCISHHCVSDDVGPRYSWSTSNE